MNDEIFAYCKIKIKCFISCSDYYWMYASFNISCSINGYFPLRQLILQLQASTPVIVI